MSGGPVTTRLGPVVLHDLHHPAADFRADVVGGLSRAPKQLPPKYFYDDRGARLFERICELDAYYPTRTELGILERSIDEIARAIGPEARIVEFGSGSGVKTRLLLEHLESPASYLPVDISRAQLVQFALSVADRFPELEVLPVCADYTRPLTLPEGRRAGRTVAFFPGSSIGNFVPSEATTFLAQVARMCGEDGGLLIGIDLRKEVEVLERAYDDPEGVTAEFNRNLLHRINRECGADFDVQTFRHHAWFDDANSRIEMRLVSDRAQDVSLPARGSEPAQTFRFAAGEHISTEYSYKYTVESFERLARGAGWRIDRVWTDPREWFAVALLRR